MPGTVAHAYHSSAGETQAGGSLGSDIQYSLFSKLQANEKPCFKGGGWHCWERRQRLSSAYLTHKCPCFLMNTHACLNKMCASNVYERAIDNR